jgi:hypothetical protein
MTFAGGKTKETWGKMSLTSSATNRSHLGLNLLLCKDKQEPDCLNHTSLTYLLTYKDEPFLRSCQFAATRELPSILWNPKVPYCVHKRPPLVPILSQIDPAHTITAYLSKIYFNIVHSPMSWSS